MMMIISDQDIYFASPSRTLIYGLVRLAVAVIGCDSLASEEGLMTGERGYGSKRENRMKEVAKMNLLSVHLLI